MIKRVREGHAERLRRLAIAEHVIAEAGFSFGHMVVRRIEAAVPIRAPATLLEQKMFIDTEFLIT